MFRFSPKYLILTVLLTITEVFIALFINDNFIRPYLGDVLVVILIYCFIRTFLKVSVFAGVSFVLALSFLIEFLQYLDFIAVIGLENSRIAGILLGRFFSWEDLVAYTVGAILILAAEKLSLKRKENIENKSLP